MDSMQRRADRATPNLSRASPRETRTRVFGAASRGLLLSVLAGLLPATAFAVQCWERYYNSSGESEGFDAHQTRDGGIIVATEWDLSAALLRTNSAGDSLWLRCYDGPPHTENCRFNFVSITPDQGFMAAGTRSDSGLYLVRTDSLGNPLWTRSYPDDLDCTDFEPTRGGGYIVLSDSYTAPALVLLDSVGNVVWKRVYPYWMLWNGGVRQTRDQGFIVAEVDYKSGVGYTGRLIRVDSLGRLIWSRLYGLPPNGDCYSFWAVDTMDDGGFMAAGWAAPSGSAVGTGWLVRAGANGDSLWSRFYPGSPGCDFGFTALCRSPSGDLVLWGYESPAIGVDHCRMVSVDKTGACQWSRVYGRPDRQYGTNIRQATDGYIATGRDASGGEAVYLVRTDLQGSAAIDARENPERQAPAAVRLALNALDAAEPGVRYYIRSPSPVVLTVYDVEGRRVAACNAGMQAAGWHEAALRAALPTGVSIVHLDACGQEARAKVVRIR